MRSLHDPWTLGGLTLPNRVMLAPLAGIGNWFVRLQAKRYGAGLAVSEMISSFAIHYGNAKTLNELLVVHPDEGPVAIQLLGQPIGRMGAAARRKRGLHFIPEERLGRGAVPSLSLANNMLLTRNEALRALGWIDRAALRNQASGVIRRYWVKAPGPAPTVPAAPCGRASRPPSRPACPGSCRPSGGPSPRP